MTDLARKFGFGGGGISGLPSIGYLDNNAYIPHYVFTDSNTALTTTATRLYYVPFFVQEGYTFTDIITSNSGAGDNGEKYHVGVYANDGTEGPGTLISAGGEVTLTGASALRTVGSLAIDLSAYAEQWVWLAMHFESESAMYRMTLSDGTSIAPSPIGNVGGVFGARTLAGGNGTEFMGAFKYVDTAYAVLASTAVAPTAGTATAPVIALRRTP